MTYMIWLTFTNGLQSGFMREDKTMGNLVVSVPSVFSDNDEATDLARTAERHEGVKRANVVEVKC